MDNGYAKGPDIAPYHVGDRISAIDAINHRSGEFGVDTRPKIYDNVTKQWVLLDSGSCVSCQPAGPNDIIDPSFKLRSVNGGQIDTFGTKTMTLRMGRKTYEIEAIVAAVPAPIFGWDIFRKYRLSLDWNDKEELILVDKKACISSVLKHEVIPANSVPRIQEINKQVGSDQAFFELQCMKQLDTYVNAMTSEELEGPFVETSLPFSSEADPECHENEKTNLAALTKLEEKYARIIRKFPNILKNTFKSEPKHKIYHHIDTGSEKPVKTKVRPLLATSEKSQQGRKIWEEMEALGVIERVHPSTLNEWSSALHLVRKPSGKGWRPCVDFRAINNRTKSESYPLPKLKSFSQQLKGSKIFSVIDLRSAFWNLAIHPDSKSKTCTLSPWGGAYVFNRLPFGLKNGPGSWMKFLDHVLSGIPKTFAYLDDLLVHSENEQEHQDILEQIFRRLEDNGLSLALDKCVFGKKAVDYLGFEVSQEGLSPLKRKVEAVYNIPPPTSQKQLLQFLGALNYFRANLSGLVKRGKFYNTAALLQPLYSAATVKLPKQKFLEVWNTSTNLQEAFLDAKKLLINATKLGFQDPNLPLSLYTDASDHSVGAVLMQVQNGKNVPLGYFSRHLPVEKSNWAVYRKELLAAQAGLRYFIEEIYGRHCTIWTDHLPLVSAYNGQGFQLHDPVAQRALLEISQFTKDIKHISGAANGGSDFFSRIPPPNDKKGSVYSEISVLEGHKLEALSPAVLHEAQSECSDITEIKNGKCSPSTKFQLVPFGKYELFCEVSGAQPRPYLPEKLRLFVQKQLHFDHKGQKEAIRRISSHYFWKNISEDTVNFIKTCHGCQSNKPSKLKPPHIGEFSVPDQRFSHIHLDIVGPLPPSKGYKYILTIKDRSTRFVQGIPLISPTSEAIAEAFMLHWAALFGLPSVCTSDHGPNLTSGIFKGLQENLGIQVSHSPIYFPQTNGMIERSHQTLKNSIKAHLIEMGDKYQENWVQYLPWALLGLRSSYNNDLGTSSAEMTLGMHPQLPGTLLADPEDIDYSDSHVGTILRKLQLKNNRVGVPASLNKPNPTVPNLPDNISHVYVRQHDVKGLSSKYIGPFVVVSRPSRSTIGIKVGLHRDGSDRLEIRHLSDIKVAYLRNDAEIASRPKRGRPPKQLVPDSSNSRPVPDPRPTLRQKQSSNVSNQNKPDATSRVTRSMTRSRNLDQEPAFHGFPSQAAILLPDFSVPPPEREFLNDKMPTTTRADPIRAWTATKADLSEINRAINTRGT